MLAIYFNINSQLQSKDSEIANLNDEIANLNSQINQINSTGSSQQMTIDRLEKLKGLTDQIFYPGAPYDPYSYDWAGHWSSVTSFHGSTSPANSSLFQIQSPYHLFRLNITLTGSTAGGLEFSLIQIVGSEEIMVRSISMSSEKNYTFYVFAENIGASSYYLRIDNTEGISAWAIGVEQLNQ
jgi:uncharacterized protein YdcH (DUF465 family)